MQTVILFIRVPLRYETGTNKCVLAGVLRSVGFRRPQSYQESYSEAAGVRGHAMVDDINPASR